MFSEVLENGKQSQRVSRVDPARSEIASIALPQDAPEYAELAHAADQLRLLAGPDHVILRRRRLDHFHQDVSVALLGILSRKKMQAAVSCKTPRKGFTLMPSRNGAMSSP
jgi:hypothetical protein